MQLQTAVALSKHHMMTLFQSVPLLHISLVLFLGIKNLKLEMSAIQTSFVNCDWCILAWWQLWNFMKCQAKFNRFSYHNDHIQRIFWYLVRLFKSELSKIGNFQISDSFFESEFHLIFLEVIFLSEYQSRTTTFKKNI